MSHHDINYTVRFSFVDMFSTSVFNPKLHFLELPVKSFSMSVGKAAVPSAKNFMKNMEEKVSLRKAERKESLFLTGDSLALC